MIGRVLPWVLLAEIAGTLWAWAQGYVPWECALVLCAAMFAAWVAASEAAIATEPRTGVEQGVMRLWPTRWVLVWARIGAVISWEVVRG